MLILEIFQDDYFLVKIVMQPTYNIQHNRLKLNQFVNLPLVSTVDQFYQTPSNQVGHNQQQDQGSGKTVLKQRSSFEFCIFDSFNEVQCTVEQHFDVSLLNAKE